jgi:hypothetical protein
MEESPEATIPAAEGSSANERRGGAATRRKLILRGLIGAPVALAAMHPVKTLAGTYYCSCSGWQSFAANPTTSAAPKGSCAQGHGINHYGGGNNWPGSCKSYTGVSVSCVASGKSATQWLHLFGGDDKTTCASYLSAGSTQATFICSIFNATQVADYPFNCSQIYSYWTTPTNLGPNCTLADCVNFFNQLNSGL